LRKGKASCYFSDLLEAYALNHFQEPQRVRLEEHLLLCEGCRSGLIEVEVYISVFKAAVTARRETPPLVAGDFVENRYELHPRPGGKEDPHQSGPRRSRRC
jgi:hypothetical protein